MLGPKANWVRNVKAAGGHAILRRRGREAVTLEEIPAEQRAPVLRRYLAVAPGARPHIAVDPRAPLSAFEGIAGHYPVFRIRARSDKHAAYKRRCSHSAARAVGSPHGDRDVYAEPRRSPRSSTCCGVAG